MLTVDKGGVKDLSAQFLKTGMTQNSIAITEEILDFGFWILIQNPHDTSYYAQKIDNLTPYTSLNLLFLRVDLRFY